MVWVLLNNDLSPSVIWCSALLLGILIPLGTSAYWPGRPRVGAPLMMIEFMLVVLWDIVVSNIQVAYLILFRRGDTLRSRFITPATRPDDRRKRSPFWPARSP